MSYTLNEAAICASVLGTLFYSDPTDARCEAALSYFESADSEDQWPQLNDSDKDAFAVICQSLETLDETNPKIETLHETFTRVLVGPGKLPAPPWGSVYTDHDSVIFGNKTLEVRDWMRANGVQMNLGSYEPEDHFGLLLIMLAWSIKNTVPREAIFELLEQHILPWAPRFLELFIEGSKDTFYEGLGMLALSSLNKWQEEFSLEPPTYKLYR